MESSASSKVQVNPPATSSAPHVSQLLSRSRWHQCIRMLVVLTRLCASVADAILDKNVEREILNHRRLNHVNILGFREVFATDSQLCIVVSSMQYMPYNARLHNLLAADRTLHYGLDA